MEDKDSENCRQKIVNSLTIKACELGKDNLSYPNQIWGVECHINSPSKCQK